VVKGLDLWTMGNDNMGFSTIPSFVSIELHHNLGAGEPLSSRGAVGGARLAFSKGRR